MQTIKYTPGAENGPEKALSGLVEEGGAMDILLDNDGDLYVSPKGDIDLRDSVAQDIRIQLRWFLGEWQWDRDLGVPYWDLVFIKNPDIEAIEDEIREQIFNVTQVTEVRSVKIDYSPKERTAKVRFVACTDFETIQEEVSIKCLITA